MTLYRYIPVWKRTATEIVLYRCFEVPGLGFSVQSADYFQVTNLSGDMERSEKQFLELLLEEAPELRSKPEATVELAIKRFDEDFEN